MLKLNKEMRDLDPILDDKEYEAVQKEIAETDREIDERVFELYGGGGGGEKNSRTLWQNSLLRRNNAIQNLLFKKLPNNSWRDYYQKRLEDNLD